MRRINLFSGFLVMICLLNSCNFAKKNDVKSGEIRNDSIQLTNLLKNIYKWHNPRSSEADFDIIVKDSFQVGVDTNNLKKTLLALKETGFFNEEFLKNYERIGRTTDYKLRTSKEKYLNEINFSFQDEDPWTFSQEDLGSYWDNFKITKFSIENDSAQLKWTLPDIDYEYLVKFKKVKDAWKVSYMEGFDFEEVFQQ